MRVIATIEIKFTTWLEFSSLLSQDPQATADVGKAPGTPSWAVFGASWAVVGGLLCRPGGLLALLGASWAVLGASWAILGPSWAILKGEP